MTDQTLVKPNESGDTIPCDHCKSTKHTTNGHYEGGDVPVDPKGHYEGGSVPTEQK